MTAPVKLAEHRARMRRLWNDGDNSHADIAAQVGLDVDTVAAWLAGQPGYPGIIAPRTATCAVCQAPFPTWQTRGPNFYCSAWCRAEARRRCWLAWKRRARGLPTDTLPPRRQWRGMRTSLASRRVIDKAEREAKKRGVPRDVVLREWNFQREWSPVP